MQDVEIVATRGTGPGGQHRNTTNSCIVITHRPTKTRVRVDMRSQHQSKAVAFQILGAKLREVKEEAESNAANSVRRAQIGSGMRGDKIRTYRQQDNQVTDHRDGKKWRLTDWQQGAW